MRNWIQGALVLTVSLWVATAAFAGAVETAYTLDPADDPLAFSAGSATGNFLGVDPLFANNGLSAIFPDDIDCLAGVCDIINQDWVVFQIDVTGGSVDSVGFALLTETALGMGYFRQGAPIQDGTGATDTYTGSLAVPTVPTFTFLDNSTTAGLTGTSLVLFVAYGDGLLPQNPPVPFNIFGQGAAQFMTTEWGGAGIDSPIGNFTEPIEVVPEPGTALLFGMGVLMLGARARQRRS